MVQLREYVGKRMLANLKSSKWSRPEFDEYRLLEVSPSGKWAKLRHHTQGYVFWTESEFVSIVEELPEVEIPSISEKIYNEYLDKN